MKTCTQCRKSELEVKFRKHNNKCRQCQNKHDPNLPPRICRTCGCTEGQMDERKKIVKFSGRNRHCNRCNFQKFYPHFKEYIANRLASDGAFAIHENERARAKRKRRYQAGKPQEYTQRTIRAWLWNRTQRALTNHKKPGRRKIMPYNITLDFLCELWEKQNGKCAISRVPMTHQFYCPFAASIDRINSDLGYTPENVQLVCQAINLGKNKMANDKMIEFVNAIRQA